MPPDVREIDGYLYFSASRRQSPSPILRSADPLTQPFEEVAAPFPFWDPDLFLDDDGRLYFFWGCTNTDPIWGVELDRQTLEPIGERKALFAGDPERLGYERPGENGVVDKEGSAMYQMFVPYVDPVTKELNLPADAPLPDGMTPEAAKRLFHSIGQPFIEGAFMTKHNGRYLFAVRLPRHGVQHLCRRRLCGGGSPGTLHPAKRKSLLRGTRRLYHRRGPRQHHR